MAALKYSRQRESIKEFLMTRTDHPTADTVYENMKIIYPHISLGTVYRNLSLLTKLGKIKKISCEDRTDRFDGLSTPHSHFICDSCGCLLDLPYYPDSSLYQQLNKNFDGEITECSVVFHGICKKCTGKI